MLEIDKIRVKGKTDPETIFGLLEAEASDTGVKNCGGLSKVVQRRKNLKTLRKQSNKIFMIKIALYFSFQN